METNITEISNSLIQGIALFNATLNNDNLTVNISDNNSVVPVKDLYEDYKINEKHKLLLYTVMAYILAALIILSNLSVVVSSGLLLRKGQKPKSTYLLLGNVSLADAIVGVSIVYGLFIDYTLNNNAICIFQIGIMVCPAMVSIFSVCLIAVDRYIYILHGLYYERWFNTKRVRIGILLIWLISITLAFLPVTGWVNRELTMTRCFYAALFPGPLILLNSILSVIPIIVVVILYTFILFKALQTVKSINNTIQIKEVLPANYKLNVKINRLTTDDINRKFQLENKQDKNKHTIKESSSFSLETDFTPKTVCGSTSNENLFDNEVDITNLNNFQEDTNKRNKIQFESDFSTCSDEIKPSIQSSCIDNTNNQPNRFRKLTKKTKSRKIREPNKWRAIKVVFLTLSSFIFTWLPFFITVIFFVFCEEKLTNPKCIRLRALLGGPLAILAFANSILNPLIYAWWHKGFQRSAKAYYKQYLHRYICNEMT